MVHPSSKKTLLTVIAVLFVSFCFPQVVTGDMTQKDYKDREQFDRFYKRRKVIGAWQVNQLKKGALVVKLKANNLTIDALRKQGYTQLADQKMIETAAINTNMVRAYSRFYNFSKVYFIYSHMVDSLLAGKRQGLFLDSNLTVNPNLTMTEQFFLVAETDRLYNSSIGFVREDSARHITERGNPTGGEASIVLKNKYGHQLKRPFPFYAGHGITLKETPPHYYFDYNGSRVPVNIGNLSKKNSNIGNGDVAYKYNGQNMVISIPKTSSIEYLSQAVDNLNTALLQYFQQNPEPDERNKMYAEVKPFLY